MFIQPGAVERRTTDGLEADAFHPGRAGEHLRLFENRDHIGVIDQIALGIAGSKNDSLLARIFNYFISILMPEILHL